MLLNFVLLNGAVKRCFIYLYFTHAVKKSEHFLTSLQILKNTSKDLEMVSKMQKKLKNRILRIVKQST